ncbi:MAG: D-alanyl-D-alanine carboxypeptidase [Chloroflexi bacterium]|nr:MAG: D-alanyl-D-alanine carboxypeptidase [Chloroflexota bacterium]
MRVRRRWLGGVAALVLTGAALGVMHLRTPPPAHAAAVTVPAWLPAMAAPQAAPEAEALRSDWLAMHPAPDMDVHAGSAVLLDLDSGEVMWARDAHDGRPPASLTKLVTVMVAADLAASLDQRVTVPPEATQFGWDSTTMGLSAGEVVTVRDLMYGIFLVSGNDAAEALARVFTSRDHFVELMNDKAAALGMRDSHFTNPTGLDDPTLRASAYDLAVAADAISWRYPALLALAGAKDQELPATDTHKGYFLHTLIKLVSVYPGATGLKTGYTDDAGYCLVGTATRGDRHLAVVLMHSDLALTVDATRLLDYGFSLPRPEPLDPAEIPQL